MKKILITFAALFVFATSGQSRCDTSSGLDLLTRVCYECMLPLYIAGVPVAVGPMPDYQGPIDPLPVCACPFPPPIFIRIGIPLSLWNPNTVIETVNDPMCMASLGLDLSSLVPPGTLMGQDATKNTTGIPKTFMQSHKVIFPLMYLVGLFLDSVCFLQTDMDVAFVTEFDPTWNVDTIAQFLQPEAVLFGNPASALSCMGDAAAAAGYATLDPLYWCKGSHGMAYPMTGNVQSKGMVEDAASISENFIYHQHRLGLGNTSLMCTKIPTPFWKKSDYRLQILKPVPHPIGFTVGQTGLMWDMGKNIPFKGDNFVFLIFKKYNCCAF